MRSWLNYFQNNQRNRLPVPWEHGIDIDTQLKAPLIHSLTV